MYLGTYPWFNIFHVVEEQTCLHDTRMKPQKLYKTYAHYIA